MSPTLKLHQEKRNWLGLVAPAVAILIALFSLASSYGASQMNGTDIKEGLAICQKKTNDLEVDQAKTETKVDNIVDILKEIKDAQQKILDILLKRK
jgi:hypothetical protein